MATINGTTASETLSGTAANDVISGLAGDDRVLAGEGGDTVYGDAKTAADTDGGDELHGEAGADKLYGRGGNDALLGGPGIDALYGDAGQDALDGGAEADRLEGGAGNDLLDGGTGADQIYGGAGDDAYLVDNAADKAIEGAASGTDTVRSSVAFTLGNNVENLELTGAAAVGGTGNALANAIRGNGADNAIRGAGGDDALDGGAGLDTAVFAGARAAYRVTPNPDGSVAVVDLQAASDGNDGTDTLRGFETLRFKDGSVALGANAPPSAGDDAATTPQDTPIEIAPATLLANDGDPDGDALTIAAVGSARNGTVARNASTGAITFTPEAGFSGAAGFEYTVSDGRGGTDVGRVDVEVEAGPQNTPPEGRDDGYETARGQALAVGAARGVLANDVDADGDPLTATLIQAPEHGTLDLAADGSFTYTPFAGFVGADGFLYQADDGAVVSGNTAVSIAVTAPANDAPSGADAALATDEDTPYALRVGDFGFADPDAGDALQAVRIESLPRAGSLALGGVAVTAGQVIQVEDIAAGRLVFSAAGDESGLPYAGFGFRVSDGLAFSAEANAATVDVNPVSDAPRLEAAPARGQANAAIPLSIEAASADADGSETLSLTLAGVPAGAVLSAGSAGPNGTWTLAPADLPGLTITPPRGASDFVLSVTATARDGAAAPASATASLPVAVGSALDVPTLGTLDGRNGFRIEGVQTNDLLGRSVDAAGDVNGDGHDDVIVGASTANPNGIGNAGAAYVVFGKGGGFPASLPMSGLNGQNGFRLSGEAANDEAGFWVSGAGDVNGDGFDDIVTGARTADVNGVDSGAAYVVFGKASGWSADVRLSTLDGADGFEITGFQINGEAAGDNAGRNVGGGGDIDGDGYDDIVVGSYLADTNGTDSGAAYVIYGRAGDWAANLELSALDGTDGFRIDGFAPGSWTGVQTRISPDLNGDGHDDLLIGSNLADTNGTNSGAVHVVFGRPSGFGARFDIAALDGSNGMRIDGDRNNEIGWTMNRAGDVDGDGFNDLLIGSRNADPNGSNSGSAYVVFGKASGWSPVFKLANLNGNNGFQLDGAETGDRAGRAIASVDLNDDGFDEVVVGAPYAQPNGLDSGKVYVVFGKGSWAARTNLASIEGTEAGFSLAGLAPGDDTGWSANLAGDVDGDGKEDLIVGAQGVDPGGRSNAGAAYVIFGDDFRPSATPAALAAGGFWAADAG